MAMAVFGFLVGCLIQLVFSVAWCFAVWRVFVEGEENRRHDVAVLIVLFFLIGFFGMYYLFMLVLSP